MGEVEQRELRLAERNKVLQMDAIKVSGDVRFDWICPECGNLNDIGLRAFVYAINHRAPIVCAACKKSFQPYLDVPDRAAELPLEPTAPIPAADNRAEQVQCPKCGYWVNLYDGNKIVLHKDYSLVGKPYCQLSGTEYTPLP